MSTAQVERIELGELAAWRIRHAGAELLVAQQGAQILGYRREGERPLIWLSPQAAYRRGQSVRGGVPVCWPWFGDLQRNPPAIQATHRLPAQAGAHGLVRDRDWQLQDIARQDDGVHLAFTFSSAEQPLADWPQAAELDLRIHLGERLDFALLTRNLNDTPLPLSQALHSYFAVSDIRKVRVEGLEDCPYIDSLDAWRTHRQQGALKFQGETDRIYLQTPARLTIVDETWQRRIHLHSEGTASAVVWNPWIGKARRLSQFADDAWQDMLCIEHANVMDDHLLLAPDAQHRLAVSLWSQTNEA